MLELPPFIEQLSIKTKEAEIRKFDLNYIDPEEGDLGWAQRPFVAEIESQYDRGLPVRIIVLKARQLGISTATEAVLFLWAMLLHQRTSSLVMSHEDPAAQKLFLMTKLFWETWPLSPAFRKLYNTKRGMTWDNGSSMEIATARNTKSARGSTIHALHASEVAFWPDPKTLMGALGQSLPERHGTISIMESTANGIGNWFYEQWEAATYADAKNSVGRPGFSEFKPMFFPWYKHSAYRNHPMYNTKLELSLVERELYDLMTLDGLREEEIYAALTWRIAMIHSTKISGDADLFMQEYPATPYEAFITTGRPIFDIRKLQAAYHHLDGVSGDLHGNAAGEVVFEERDDGRLTIFKDPKPDGDSERFFVAGDPSKSVAGDPSCIQVIDRATFEQVAVWHGNVNPMDFAEIMMNVGYYYNTAMLCPEVDGGGQAAIPIMLRGTNPYRGRIWLNKKVDHLKDSINVFGWMTNWNTKQTAIGTLQKLILDGSLDIHDHTTFIQLRNFVQHDNGEWSNSAGDIHDDAVMALAIAVAASTLEGPYIPKNIYDNPFTDIYTQELEKMERGYSESNQRRGR